MALSWNEIRDRAVAFSKEWQDAEREEAEAQSFLNDFFNVFGVSRRKVGTFEKRVSRLSGRDGYIDFLWKGMILVEMKTAGKDLDKAFKQASEYTHGLKDEELPKFILTCDFKNFQLYDLEEQAEIAFTLEDLPKNIKNFGALAGYQKRVYEEQDPVNVQAAELMGKLHDRLKEIGYDGHPLEVYLVRLLFCLFAEDTSIFQRDQFLDFIEHRTREDGSDLAAKLQELFQVLNTPKKERFKNLDEELMEFPYVNGKLFEEVLPTASFESKMRQSLMDCCRLDWSKISPAIFGSMFQSVMNPKERRDLGAHYTSEKNILKVIEPLFLDALWSDFEKIKNSSSGTSKTKKLQAFHQSLSKLKFLDPACGCGNFLVITYRELRLLELEILRTLHSSGQRVIDVSQILWLNIDQFYGIEYEEFPARIAEVAMWLMDHQMNMVVSNEFGQYFARLPLTKSATIIHGNALRIDWNDLLTTPAMEIEAKETTVIVAEPSVSYQTVNIKTQNLTVIDNREGQSDKTFYGSNYDYIIGNPPFIGKYLQSEEQKMEMADLFSEVKGAGVLDYVASWYLKAAQLIMNTRTKVGFVSTNSIVQGEQIGVLWNLLFKHYGIKIHFAHRTFSWHNEARGNAAVHVVIIGFAAFDTKDKSIFVYEDIKGEPHEIPVQNINPYLVDAADVFIEKKRNPICNVPKIVFGNMPNDGGFLLMSDEEKEELCREDKILEKYTRPLLSAREFLNNGKRWCIWLKDYNPSEIKNSPEILKRIESVHNYRLASKRAATQKLAATPYLFGEIRQPDSDFVLIPLTSSERRNYIPIGFFDKDVIPNNTMSLIPNATLYHFGVLTSQMHMIWVNNVCGRLKADYRYSNEIVYNNYPWPENPSASKVADIEAKAQKVLTIRQKYPESSLADLYDPLLMPADLVKAHQALDNAVDKAYRSAKFKNDAERMEFLFGEWRGKITSFI